MFEKIYNFSTEEIKRIEKLIDDNNVAINHMILLKGDGLPEHYSNSNIYMIVAKGILTLKLNEQKENKYSSGQIINIPYNIKMNVDNFDDEVLELFVIKSPNPKNYKE